MDKKIKNSPGANWRDKTKENSTNSITKNKQNSNQQNIFDVVKEEIPVLEYAEANYKVGTVGSSYKIEPCPFCKNPDCFRIDPIRNIWSCFDNKGGCNTRGNSVIDFKIMENCEDPNSFDDPEERLKATKQLASEYGLQVDDIDDEELARMKKKQKQKKERQELMEAFIDKAHDNLKEEHRKKLRARGFSDHFIDKQKIGYCGYYSIKKLKQAQRYEDLAQIGAISVKDDKEDLFLAGDRIIMPIFKRGKPVYYIMWDPGEGEPFNPSNNSDKLDIPKLNTPFIFNRANNKDKEVWIVEGVTDYYSMVQAEKNVMLAFGVNNTKDIIKRIERNKEYKYLIAFDNDSAGNIGAEKILKEVDNEDIQAVELPLGKDVNNVLQEVNGNIDQFKRRLERLKWPDPLPFAEHNVEELEPDLLPDWLANYIKGVSASIQVPEGMAVMLSLSALGTALANKGKIKVKVGYDEPLQIWTATVLASGNRKSPVFNKMIEPIEEYEKKKQKDVEPEKDNAETQLDILEDREKKLRKLAKNTDKRAEREKKMEKINELKAERREMEVPAIPTLNVDDVTSESLAQLMADNNDRIAILSPEGDLFKMMGGIYSQKVNLGIYKKGWTGDESHNEVRIGRNGVKIDSPAITIGLTVQPTVLSELDDKKIFKGEGLIGRFLYLYPESIVGYRKGIFDSPEIDELEKSRYKKGMQALLNSDPKAIEDGEWEPHILELSNTAKDVLANFEREVEKKMRPGGELDHFKSWANKLIGNTIRMAGLIHLADQVDAKNGKVDNLWSNPISRKNMLAAIKIAEKLIPHALKISDLLDLDPEIKLARYVLRRIEKGKEKEEAGELAKGKEELDKAMLLELCRGTKHINKPKDLRKPLDLLEELNHIKVVEVESSGRGRKPSPKIKINPKVYSINKDNGKNDFEDLKELSF